MSAISEKIQDLVGAGFNVENEFQHAPWQARVESFLRRALNSESADEFNKLSGQGSNWYEARASQIGMLEGLAVLTDQNSPGTAPDSSPGAIVPKAAPTPQFSKRVFVVHGRDTEVKESVARFLERLGLEPIILHEQPSSGRTVIEKFEVYADVGFAVVLLTPDDVGGVADEPPSLQGRARQNVILELGYFLGRLSRRRVCALHKKNVEIPSDYQGVVYVEFDPAGAWRTKLAQELVEAKFSINVDALLKS
jgi:hypothetical protein